MYYNQKESGKRIAELRKEKGLTQEQLAEKLNISMLWSSIFVTLVAKKYHESVTLPSGLRMVYDNH